MKKQYLDFSKLNFICKEMRFFWGKKKILPSEPLEDTKLEDTKNTDLVEVSRCEIVVKSRIKIQTSGIKLQTQTKKPQICSNLF